MPSVQPHSSLQDPTLPRREAGHRQAKKKGARGWRRPIACWMHCVGKGGGLVFPFVDFQQPPTLTSLGALALPGSCDTATPVPVGDVDYRRWRWHMSVFAPPIPAHASPQCGGQASSCLLSLSERSGTTQSAPRPPGVGWLDGLTVRIKGWASLCAVSPGLIPNHSSFRGFRGKMTMAAFSRWAAGPGESAAKQSPVAPAIHGSAAAYISCGKCQQENLLYARHSLPIPTTPLLLQRRGPSRSFAHLLLVSATQSPSLCRSLPRNLTA